MLRMEPGEFSFLLSRFVFLVSKGVLSSELIDCVLLGTTRLRQGKRDLLPTRYHLQAAAQVLELARREFSSTTPLVRDALFSNRLSLTSHCSIFTSLSSASNSFLRTLLVLSPRSTSGFKSDTSTSSKKRSVVFFLPLSPSSSSGIDSFSSFFLSIGAF